MNATFRSLMMTAILIGLLHPVRSGHASPISKSDFQTLLKFLKPAEVVGKIEADGVAFDADEATLDELRRYGATDEIVSAIRTASTRTTPAPSQGAISYDDVRSLLKLRLPEAKLLEIVNRSATVFTLDAAQERELQQLGASQTVISALKGGPSAVRDVGEVTDLAIIFDCSGSMKETTSDGEQKMAAAKRVVTDLIKSIPNGLGLTLVVYGHDARLRCRAVDVLHPLEDLNDSNRARIVNSIARLRPVGATPIALALKAAREELARKQSPNCGVILVSDGKETCHGDPAVEAAALVNSVNAGLGLHVVGFDVSDDERAALEEIRRAAGEHGYYHEARDARELSILLPKVTEPVVSIPEPAEQAIVKRRGLKVLAPTTLPLPPLGRFAVVEANDYPPESQFYDPVFESPTYGRELRISSPDTKYDIYWIPKEGESVRMMAEVTFEKEEMIVVRPEDFLALAKVTGEGLPTPKAISFGEVDDYGISSPFFKRQSQTATAYGQQFVVPAGNWDLWIQPNDGSKAFRLEQDLRIRPGVLNRID